MSAEKAIASLQGMLRLQNSPTMGNPQVGKLERLDPLSQVCCCHIIRDSPPFDTWAVAEKQYLHPIFQG